MQYTVDMWETAHSDSRGSSTQRSRHILYVDKATFIYSKRDTAGNKNQNTFTPGVQATCAGDTTESQQSQINVLSSLLCLH